MLKSFITYCKESYEELAHKTTWPTRMELTSNAIAVLIASIVIAIAVGFADKLFEKLMSLIYSI